MRQAKEDGWNHDSDDHPPPCSGDALGQVLDRVSAIRRLLPESYGRNGDDADQDRGYKGLARGRGKAAGNVHPAHGELHCENPEQQQRAQHQCEAEVDRPPLPAEMETVVTHPAMIEHPTRQVQRGGDQKREHQRPNEGLIKVWKAGRQTGPHAAIYRGQSKQYH